MISKIISVRDQIELLECQNFLQYYSARLRILRNYFDDPTQNYF